MKSITAWLPISNTLGSGTGSSADRIASDQPRSGSRSSRGISSRLPITSIGIRAAKSPIISTESWFSRLSSRSSISWISPGSIFLIALRFNAPIINRRTRVCNGGSLKTRLVVWCSSKGLSPNFGENSASLSELVRGSR